MNNLYSTLERMRDVASDSMQAQVVKYDKRFLKLARSMSRWIDQYLNTHFYPQYQVMYFNGRDRDGYRFDGYIPPAIEIAEIAVSEDNGQTYTALASSDFFAMVDEEDYNGLGAFTFLRLATEGAYSHWPTGERSIRVTGWWGECLNRDEVWVGSDDTVQDDPLEADATTLTVEDLDDFDELGYTPRFSAGNLIRIDDEIIEILATSTEAETATIKRGCNGTTAAEHEQGAAISIFYPPPFIQEAMNIQATHQFKRGQTGFANAEALPDLGKVLHFDAFDPEAMQYIDDSKLGRLGFG